MQKTYLKRRKEKNYTSYRLYKRVSVIQEILRQKSITSAHSILDVGTSDGMVLRSIVARLNSGLAVGIDNDIRGFTCQEHSADKNLKFILADAREIPFKSATFDLLLATAVIEHINDTCSLITELRRVLKDGGIICLTLPNPFFDVINTFFNDTGHVRRFGIKRIKMILESNGFEVISAQHAMLFPFYGLPLERKIEKLIKFFKLDFILFNHITLAKRI